MNERIEPISFLAEFLSGSRAAKGINIVATVDIKDSVNQQFSQVAANYTTSTVHAKGIDLPEMLTNADLTGAERVLDAGTGAGHTALLFAPHVAHVTAVDLSDAMLAQCTEQAREQGIDNVEFLLGDVEKLEFADESFDLIVSRYSAHHWPHPQRALAEFRRVLKKPHGRFLLSDIVSFDDFTTDTFVQAIELLRDTSHVRDHTIVQWQAMFAEAGFESEAVYTWELFLEFQSWVTRMQTPPHNVTMLETLLANAADEVKQALKIQADHSFTYPGAIIRGRISSEM